MDILKDVSYRQLGLHIPSVEYRATGKSMGEHCEEMAKEWEVPRDEQDELAFPKPSPFNGRYAPQAVR